MMSYELNIIPTAFLTGLVFFNFIFGYKNLRNTRINIVNGLLFIQVFSQITFPGIYGFINDYPQEVLYKISPIHLFIVYIVELVSISCWLIGFYWFRPLYKHVEKCSFFPGLSDKKIDWVLITIIIMMYYVVILEASRGLGVVMYDSENLGESIKLWPTGITIPFGLWNIIISLFYFPGILAGGILATNNQTSGLKKGKVVGWAVLFSMIVMGLVTALRQFILGSVIMIFIFGLAQNNKTVLKYAVVGLMILFSLAPIMQGSYRDVLWSAEGKELSSIEKLALLTTSKKDAKEENPFVTFWHAAGNRFIDAALSAGLVKAVLRGDSAGLQPVLGAIASPIPRLFWPGKPAPGSFDGTNEGTATYVVWRETIEGMSWECGPFTSGSHSFWELNMVGVILFGILSGLFARTMLHATINAGKIGLVFWGLTFHPLAFIVNLWAPEIIMVLMQRILPLGIFIWCWSWFSRLRVNFPKK